MSGNTAWHVKLLQVLYTATYYLILPIIVLRLLWRSRQNPAYRKHWLQRFGFITPITNQHGSIWVHAVSVGESLAAIPLVKALKQQYPQHTIIMTTTTPTGAAQVKQNLGDIVVHCYTPYDVPTILNRFLNRAAIKFCIIMETELWPNLLRSCSKHGVPVMLANARMSQRSTSRYQKIHGITKMMLNQFTMVAAQAKHDADHFLQLGLAKQRLMISGNIKFDMQLPNNIKQQGEALRAQWTANARPILIAASTHEGEEAIIVEAFQQMLEQRSDLLLVIVPRHPERFAKVKQLCEEQQLSVVTRSSGNPVAKQHQVLLGDTMGELRLFYAAADIAFVGGSLAPIGGHNFIEPAAVGIPLLSGPHLHNFTDISRLLINAKALEVVTDADSLAKATLRLIESPSACQAMGDSAYQVIEQNRGALQKHLAWIKSSLSQQV